MCPYADLANHSETPEIEWEVSEAGSLLFVATCAAEQGDILHLCYGRKSPQQMLWLYGFVPAPPWDPAKYAVQVELQRTSYEQLCEGATDADQEEMSKTWESVTGGGSTAVCVGVGPCSKQLQSALPLARLANLSSYEWCSIQEETTAEEVLKGRMSRAVSIANEKLALRALGGLVGAKRDEELTDASSLSPMEVQLRCMTEDVAQVILWAIGVALLVLECGTVTTEQLCEANLGAYRDFAPGVLADYLKALHCQLVMLGGLMLDHNDNAGCSQLQITASIETVLRQMGMDGIWKQVEGESNKSQGEDNSDSDSESDSDGDCLDPVFLYNFNVMLD